MTRALEVAGLGKSYTLGEDFARYRTLRESITSSLRRRRAEAAAEFWALREVGFALEQGEALGVIGRNGAGKTTLLRILSRITEPTVGVSRTRGRVGTLLEVGTGFHPELTGRENIHLNGAILGMSSREVGRRFDEIVDFADVERFLDTPLKRYSSGMQVRLAFAVAAHLEPEILIVDEVLAVGDVAFQQKCLDRMGDVARGGRTVLFVSHNMGAIEALCGRAICLERGRLVADGAPREVIGEYLANVISSRRAQTWDDPASAPGNDQIRLRRASAYPEGGSPADPITVHTPIVLDFEYDNLVAGARLNLSLHVFSADGTLVLNAVPVSEREWYGQPYPAGRFRDRCRIPADLLNDGGYRIELLVVKDGSHVLFEDSAILELMIEDVVDPSRGVFEGEWGGVVRPPVAWRTEHLSESD